MRKKAKSSRSKYKDRAKDQPMLARFFGAVSRFFGGSNLVEVRVVHQHVSQREYVHVVRHKYADDTYVPAPRQYGTNLQKEAPLGAFT